MFKALVLQQEEGNTVAEIADLNVDQLPEGDVLVEVDYSSINYKDGLAITGTGKIIRDFPMVPGIDMVGTVLQSESSEFTSGDKVVLTGWGVGENHWGGLSQRARLNANWLVKLPEGMPAEQSMAIGTAGLTAMLCVMALEDGGVQPEDGPVVVTGAAGGVGSVATAILAKLGYEVYAVTGRPETSGYLTELGAEVLVDRKDMEEKARPLEKQRWAGAIDTVGDQILARVLAECCYGATVAACGLAAGFKLPTTVMPFILRNVRLQGVDSVYCPKERRQQAWQRLQQDLPDHALTDIANTIGLSESIEAAQQIVAGQVRGRLIVDVNR